MQLPDSSFSPKHFGPLSKAACEHFMEKNLHMRCFVRDDQVLREEFIGDPNEVLEHWVTHIRGALKESYFKL